MTGINTIALLYCLAPALTLFTYAIAEVATYHTTSRSSSLTDNGMESLKSSRIGVAIWVIIGFKMSELVGLLALAQHGIQPMQHEAMYMCLCIIFWFGVLLRQNLCSNSVMAVLAVAIFIHTGLVLLKYSLVPPVAGSYLALYFLEIGESVVVVGFLAWILLPCRDGDILEDLERGGLLNLARVRSYGSTQSSKTLVGLQTDDDNSFLTLKKTTNGLETAIDEIAKELLHIRKNKRGLACVMNSYSPSSKTGFRHHEPDIDAQVTARMSDNHGRRSVQRSPCAVSFSEHSACARSPVQTQRALTALKTRLWNNNIYAEPPVVVADNKRVVDRNRTIRIALPDQGRNTEQIVRDRNVVDTSLQRRWHPTSDDQAANIAPVRNNGKARPFEVQPRARIILELNPVPAVPLAKAWLKKPSYQDEIDTIRMLRSYKAERVKQLRQNPICDPPLTLAEFLGPKGMREIVAQVPQNKRLRQNQSEAQFNRFKNNRNPANARTRCEVIDGTGAVVVRFAQIVPTDHLPRREVGTKTKTIQMVRGSIERLPRLRKDKSLEGTQHHTSEEPRQDAELLATSRAASPSSSVGSGVEMKVPVVKFKKDKGIKVYKVKAKATVSTSRIEEAPAATPLVDRGVPASAPLNIVGAKPRKRSRDSGHSSLREVVSPSTRASSCVQIFGARSKSNGNLIRGANAESSSARSPDKTQRRTTSPGRNSSPTALLRAFDGLVAVPAKSKYGPRPRFERKVSTLSTRRRGSRIDIRSAAEGRKMLVKKEDIDRLLGDYHDAEAACEDTESKD